MSDPLRIVVGGMLAANPGQGGATWAILQYVLGFMALGHDVLVVEEVPAAAIRPEGAPLRQSENARYFGELVAELGLEERAALRAAGSDDTVGVSIDDVQRFSQSADVIVNESGLVTDERFLESIPVRVYLDVDPAFTQLWQEEQGIDMRFGTHTHFATVGAAIGTPDCDVPTCGLEWIPTLPPVVLEQWPVADRIERDALTTVGNWRGYGSIERGGVLYGQKVHSMRHLMPLPTLVEERFTPAFGIHPDEASDLEALRDNGWTVLDPAEVAGTPARYRAFVQGSKAELGVSKSGYVLSRCGWFSDRSACYLASGRPVVAQDTGFGRSLPTGKGLLPFAGVEDAVVAIEEMNADYAGHARAARELAREHLDARVVLPRLLEAVS